MSSTTKTATVVCFGEVLFDVFPSHQKIGGAPLNVGLRLSSLGLKVQIISRVGNDALGNELLEYVAQNGVDTAAIQLDETHSTGEVMVLLNDKGSASYTINYPVAWDKIVCNPENEITVKQADAFVFGSLVCRDTVSHDALFELINYAKYKIFDVNLRAPFYSKELLISLMMQSDFIKFNDDELYEISAFMNSPYNSLEQNILFIAAQTNTKHICVTKGSHGAVLYYDEKLYYNSGYKITVADTVGAGDSFLAGLLSKLLTQNDPQSAIDFACALGGLVAQNEGANPKITNQEIKEFMNL
ncbi:carbohydrate kinase family protein [Flavobacterium restrictum]|uniref:Carbohydrate kinase n=1 Tax=Flavobacterium restrictum TaxID=2594428 RepID=A0A553EBT3_9FLAO|nr:carbohydrate kinase [Flavobacterium restrictum]TRX42401.1 carbohydrate kinase [Flavobacterium restrictum]